MTPEAPWLDISLLIHPGMPVYPGDPAVVVEPVLTLDADNVQVTRFACGSHTGTHVDAPAHFVRGGQTLAEIPLARWSGPAWVVEVPQAEAIAVGHLLTDWPAHDVVERLLIKSPNSDRWDTPVAGQIWQGLSVEAAEWLVGMGVRLVGIDALSIENDATGFFPVHHTLLGAGAVLVEGLDLRGVDAGPYELLCLPLKLDAPDGAPARAALRAR